jgi:hypothetical protein
MALVVERHRPILWVADAERAERTSALVVAVDHRRSSAHQKKRERAPVFRVVVGHDRHRGILRDVPHPFERAAAAALRLVVDHEVEVRSDERVAERYDVRCPARVRGGEAGYAVARQEGARRSIKDGGRHRAPR